MHPRTYLEVLYTDCKVSIFVIVMHYSGIQSNIYTCPNSNQIKFSRLNKTIYMAVGDGPDIIIHKYLMIKLVKL